MKAKIVKAWAFTRWNRVCAQATVIGELIPSEEECRIVICPHNWTITARPPKAKGSGKKGAKKK